MNTKMQSRLLSQLLTALVAGSLLLAACSSADSLIAQPNSTVTSTPLATMAPEPKAVPTTVSSLSLSLDTGNLITGFKGEIVAAVPDSENAPNWEVLPEYTRVTLQGYPISSHLMQPQIFIYPVMELGEVNEGAGKIVAALQSLTKSPQELQNMPFLPLFNASQVMHVQVQYLDFKNGRGVRYLTLFSQGIVPVNNNELIYTYQGLTGDGKYYVAAVVPVNHPSLPVNGSVTGNEPPEFTSDFPAYLANVVKALNSESAGSFVPDLTQLDALMSSLEVK